MTDPEALLRLLSGSEVEFILVGGAAPPLSAAESASRLPAVSCELLVALGRAKVQRISEVLQLAIVV